MDCIVFTSGCIDMTKWHRTEQQRQRPCVATCRQYHSSSLVISNVVTRETKLSCSLFLLCLLYSLVLGLTLLLMGTVVFDYDKYEEQPQLQWILTLKRTHVMKMKWSSLRHCYKEHNTSNRMILTHRPTWSHRCYTNNQWQSCPSKYPAHT